MESIYYIYTRLFFIKLNSYTSAKLKIAVNFNEQIIDRIREDPYSDEEE